jgi:hypothetical protein
MSAAGGVRGSRCRGNDGKSSNLRCALLSQNVESTESTLLNLNHEITPLKTRSRNKVDTYKMPQTIISFH